MLLGGCGGALDGCGADVGVKTLGTGVEGLETLGVTAVLPAKLGTRLGPAEVVAAPGFCIPPTLA